jgi:hypothetical protein
VLVISERDLDFAVSQLADALAVATRAPAVA